MFIHNHKTVRRVLYLSVLAIAFLTSCRDTTCRELARIEQLMETSPAEADSLLSVIPEPANARKRAWYAVLKTQLDYKLYREIESDSLIKTATEYYRTPYKNVSRLRRYRAAMAWYSQGCVYSGLNDDFSAIDAYLKAQGLFPDTLSRYYALSEQKLGIHYLNRMMLVQAKQELLDCRINALRLNDKKTANYVFYQTGLTALYGKDFNYADSIFGVILSDSTFSFSQKTGALLQMAKIRLHSDKDYINALKYVDSYIDQIRDKDQYGAGLCIKSDIYYAMCEYDSAYKYGLESFSKTNELYTMCSVADRLAELSVLNGKVDEASHWHKMYGELRDSINVIEKSRDIEELQYLHKDELNKELLSHRHIRFIIIEISSVLLIASFFFLIYYIFLNKKRKIILDKQKELLDQEAEIRRSSIQVLQARVGELSEKDQNARNVLLDLYRSRLALCRKKFNNTDECRLLLAKKIDKIDIQLNRVDKTALFEQLSKSYLESISDILSEITDIKEKEIYTLILRHLGCSINLISELFSITPVAVKQRLSRLSKRASSDFLELFTGHNINV
ncbi:MAG: hypothetical protein J6U22_09525 [Bacteroidaceae bacterium]|nr:hypothetical protein [Bacteroidaceae bacterium]